MGKPNFDYQTLDQVFTDGKIDRDKIKKMDPEAIGPETKRVMQEVYDKRVQFGENVVEFNWDSDNKDNAVQRVAREIMNTSSLRDGASFGDVYVYAAINTAQYVSHNILSAREKLPKAEDLDEVQWCSREADIRYLKGERGIYLTYWWNFEVLGKEKTNEIVDAVFKDLGFTLEEAEGLQEKYEQMSAQRKEQYKKLGIWDLPPQEHVSDYLKQLGWNFGEDQGHYLKKAVEEGVVLREPEGLASRVGGFVSRVFNLIKR